MNDLEISPSNLNSFLTGGAQLLGSSEGLPWHGVLTARHAIHPGERLNGSSPSHMIAVLMKRPAVFESTTATGAIHSMVKPQNALTLFPAGNIPSVRLRSSSELISCTFDDRLVRAIAAEEHDSLSPEFHWRSGVNDPAGAQLLRLIFAEAETGGASGKLYIDSILTALISRYVALATTQPTGTIRPLGQLHPKLLQRLREWMEANLDNEITLAALANVANYSPAHLVRSFRASTGQTPHQYLIDLRISRAERLLRGGHLSIVEITSECGFSSQAHFSRLFKRRNGVAPGQYRRGYTLS